MKNSDLIKINETTKVCPPTWRQQRQRVYLLLKAPFEIPNVGIICVLWAIATMQSYSAANKIKDECLGD
jgi:hypothetical protein